MGSVLKMVWQSSQSAYGVFKKLLLVFIVFFAVFKAFAYFISADQPKRPYVDVDKLYETALYKTINDPELKKSQQKQNYVAVYRAMLCGFTGEACANTAKESEQYVRNSLLGRVSGLIAGPMSHPPASGIVWAQESLARAGLIPQAYAAEGIGFSSIRGYMGIWSLFRNISYMLFVMFILIVGFLIMFRVQMGGQTAIAVESALPRIVVSLLVITFSFAIAGFLIDMMYVFTSIGISILYNTGHLQPTGPEMLISNISREKVDFNNATQALHYFQREWLFAGFAELFPSGVSAQATGNAIWELLPESLQYLTGFFIMAPIKYYLINILLNIPRQALDSISGITIAAFSLGNIPKFAAVIANLFIYGVLSQYIPGMLMGLLILLTIFFNAIKIFFIILGSYIKITLYIIFAPFILLFDIIPGNGTLGWWMRNLIGELLVFPTVILIMLTGKVIVHANMDPSGWTGAVARDTAIVNYIGQYQNAFRLPFMYGFHADDINMLIGMGLILLIPDFIKMVKGWVGVKDMGLNFGLGTYFGGLSVFTSGLGLYGGYQGMRRALVGYNYKDGEKGISSIPGMKWVGTLLGEKNS